MRPILALAAASLCLGVLPCSAQGVPSNPFASNYPSAPPRLVEPEGRLRPVRAARPRPPGRIERGPVPPAPIPGR